MRALRIGNRRQQVDGTARPVHQGGAAERDAGVEKTLMLAVQGQVPGELVDQHSGEEAHVGARALQHVRRRRWGENRLGVAALDDWTHVLQHHVAARLLRQAIAHLLADDLALGLRNRLNRRVRHLDGLHRHLGAEAQSAVCDRRVAHLRATLVAHRVGRHIVARGRLVHPEPGEQVELRLVVEVEALLRLAPEELALEPVELVPERVVLGLQLLERRLRLREHRIRIAQRSAEPRVLLLELGNVGCRQRLAPSCTEHGRNLSTLDPLRQPSGSVSSGVESLYPCLPPAPAARCDSAPVSPPSLPGPAQTDPAQGACSISSTRRVERQNLEHRATTIDKHEPLSDRRIFAQIPPHSGR